MLEDAIRQIRNAEADAERRIETAKQNARARVKNAQDRCAGDTESAAALAADRLSKQAKASLAASEKAVLDAKGMAMASYDSSAEFIKTKTARAVDEVFGGIIEKWQ